MMKGTEDELPKLMFVPPSHISSEQQAPEEEKKEENVPMEFV